MNVLDFNRPHEKLPHVPWKNEDTLTKGANYIRQDGKLFAWSESNCQYEYAWYWYSDSDIARQIREERPLPEGVVP